MEGAISADMVDDNTRYIQEKKKELNDAVDKKIEKATSFVPKF